MEDNEIRSFLIDFLIYKVGIRPAKAISWVDNTIAYENGEITKEEYDATFLKA